MRDPLLQEDHRDNVHSLSIRKRDSQSIRILKKSENDTKKFTSYFNVLGTEIG
jgi:hypothetical protein